MSWPWNLVAAIGLGLWLMAAPSVLGLGGGLAHGLHILGPAIVTVAVTAAAEVVRALRLLLIPAGLAVALLPWVTGGTGEAAALLTVTGVAVTLAAAPRGPVRERYGAWQAMTR